MPRAQDLYFPDFKGVIKSLGAWGGDFVLATQKPQMVPEGMVVVPYVEMVL